MSDEKKSKNYSEATLKARAVTKAMRDKADAEARLAKAQAAKQKADEDSARASADLADATNALNALLGIDAKSAR